MVTAGGLPRCVAALAGGAAISRGASALRGRSSGILAETAWGLRRIENWSSAWSGCRSPRIWTGPVQHSSQVSRTFSVRAEAVGGSEDGKLGEYDYDLVTIGAGSGGVRASRLAASHGARVAVCELPFATISSDSTGGVGGTCVLRGCVPKKILVYGSEFAHSFAESKNFGWCYETQPKHDWRTLVDHKNEEILRLTGVYKNILSSNNVTLIEGRGKVLDRHTVEIAGKNYRTRHILVATGGRAFVPDLPGKEHVITSDEALDLPSRPEKICIVGGGYIALEFAGIFNGLGSEVHVFVRQTKVLRGFDEEVREFLAPQMAMKGITFHFGESPTAIEKAADGKLTLVTNKGAESAADAIMFATGRKANTKDMGLEESGVLLDSTGAIVVDEYSRTAVESIWAVGDVTNRMNLTPVAIMEGMAFVKTVFADQPTKSDHKYVPSAVFTQPPIGTVGLTEAQALEEFGDIDVYTSNFRPMRATISGLGDRSFMKIIVDASTDVVVGVHMCGQESPEILQGFGVAVKAGLTKTQFDSTVGIHPTAAEELVTMRTPTRKLRQKAHLQAKAYAGSAKD